MREYAKENIYSVGYDPITLTNTNYCRNNIGLTRYGSCLDVAISLVCDLGYFTVTSLNLDFS